MDFAAAYPFCPGESPLVLVQMHIIPILCFAASFYLAYALHRLFLHRYIPRSQFKAEDTAAFFAWHIPSTINAVIATAAGFYGLWAFLHPGTKCTAVNFFGPASAPAALWPEECATAFGWIQKAAVVFEAFIVSDLAIALAHQLIRGDGVVHHVLFILFGTLLRAHCGMAGGACVLLVLEASTPFLNVFSFLRNRSDPSCAGLMAASFAAFSVVFVACRVVVFGAFVGVYLFSLPTLAGKLIPPIAAYPMAAFFVAAYSLQLWWLLKVTRRRRILARTPR